MTSSRYATYSAVIALTFVIALFGCSRNGTAGSQGTSEPDRSRSQSSLHSTQQEPAWNRPEMPLADDAAKALFESWIKLVASGDIEGLLSAIESQGQFALSFIKWGCSPWVAFADKDENNYVGVPGGVICCGGLLNMWVGENKESINPLAGVAWKRFDFTPATWQLVAFNGSQGWIFVNNKPCYFASCDAWKTIPPDSTIGQSIRLVMAASGDAPFRNMTSIKGTMAEDGTFSVTNAYNLSIVACPLPDRNALLCVWAYALSEWWIPESQGLLKAFTVQHLDTGELMASGPLVLLDRLLRHFQTVVDADDRTLLSSLLVHPKYTALLVKHGIAKNTP